MSETSFVRFVNPKKPRKSEVPTTIEWNNARMVRAHSIRAAVKEILNLSKALDVVKVNIIGPPSTGKTELLRTLSHLGHDLADRPYTVKIFGRDELLNFQETLSKLQPTNHIIGFDDISFLSASASGRQIKQIEKGFTEIRHLPGGQDVKIIAIFNFHYNMAISKYMRQSDFFFYTSIGSSELENTQKLVGVANTGKIMDFKQIFQQAVTTGKYHITFAKSGKKFPYLYKQPFIPLLFWNNVQARMVVSPKREWITPVCPTCTNSKIIEEIGEGKPEVIDERLKSQFKENTIKQAWKLVLHQMGVNVYPKPVKQCISAISNELKKEQCTAGQMADYYNLRDKKTRYDPKLPEGRIWTGLNLEPSVQ